MPKTFAEQFTSLVAALRADSSIEVAIAEIVPPQPSEIAEVEAMLGYSLGPEITDFYTMCGGIKLVWTPKDPDEDGIWTAEEAAAVFEDPSTLGPWLFKSGDLVGAPEGCIWIPSCKQVFGSLAEWAEIIEDQSDIFDEHRDALGESASGVSECIAPFDYSSMFYDFVFLLDGNPNPKLVRGEDNGASFSDSRLVSLPDYLEILLASKGSVSARVDAFAL